MAPARTIEFRLDDRAGVAAAMADVLAARKGWVNVRPSVDPQDVPPQPTFRLFSVRGPWVPVGTWVPPDERSRPPYISVGLQHAAGNRARAALAEVGIDIDPRWRVLSDHPRRGMVVAVPLDEDPSSVLDWLLKALAMLCSLPYDGWVADVHQGR